MLKPTATHPVVEADRALRKVRYDKSCGVALAVSTMLALWGAWGSNWSYQPLNPDMWPAVKVIWLGHFIGTWEGVRRGVYSFFEESGN